MQSISQYSSAFAALLKEEKDVKEILSFNQEDHTIIPLSTFDNDHDGNLEDLKREFENKGWCIIDLSIEKNEKVMPSDDFGWDVPTELLEKRINDLKQKKSVTWIPFPEPKPFLSLKQKEIQDLMDFFALEKEEKEKYSLPDLYGYSSVDHKESVHILTAYHMMRSNAYRIEDVAHPKLHFLKTHNNKMETFTMDFIDRMSTMLGVGIGTISHLADIPIAFKKHTNMLDIALYNNRTSGSKVSIGENTDQVNCVPHYDPGLFSLSVLSTNEGLQLYDPIKNTWFAGPVNTLDGQEKYGVLWLGNAAVKASGGKFKAGIHRVVYPRQENLKPRLTMWYEACTVEQVNSAINSDDTEEEAGNLQILNIPKNGMSIGKRETKSEVAHRVERHFGIPSSKVIRRTDSYIAYWSESKPKELE